MNAQSSPAPGGGWLSRIGALLARHPRWCAPVLGGISACGFEPLHSWPLTLLALAGLIALLARAPGWTRAAQIGWLFGVGHFSVGNGWIATAFTYQANMPEWLGWIAVVALSLYLAVYPMLAALGAWLLARRQPGALVLAFAGCWIVSEWLRSWVFTGYAWNPLAMVALGPFDRPGLASLAPWTGTYALSGLVALAAGALWLVGRSGRPLVLVLAAAGLTAVFELPSPHGSDKAGTLAFTLVQPDFRQESLADPDQFAAQFLKATGLSRPLGKPTSTGAKRLVLWPESGVPFYLVEGYPRSFYFASTYEAEPALVRQRIAEEIGPGGLLLTGATDLLFAPDGVVTGARNVITGVDDRGRIAGSYAKAHLVPYGEYLPLRWLLEPLGASRLVPGSLDFEPGPGPRTLDLGGWGKAGMQICYEIVFSGQVTDRAHRPDYIFNPSNDGWFGAWGPPQHLAQARMRAIEEGLPVLRATTTGISAVIAADGVVVRHVPRHQAGRIDGFVPPAHPPTLFSRMGNLLALSWAAILLVLSLVAMRLRRG